MKTELSITKILFGKIDITASIIILSWAVLAPSVAGYFYANQEQYFSRSLEATDFVSLWMMSGVVFLLILLLPYLFFRTSEIKSRVIKKMKDVLDDKSTISTERGAPGSTCLYIDGVYFMEVSEDQSPFDALVQRFGYKETIKHLYLFAKIHRRVVQCYIMYDLK